MMDCLTLPSFQDGNGSDCADATGTRPNVTTNALSSAIKTRGWAIAARAHFPVNFTVSTPLLQMFATVAGKITKRPQPNGQGRSWVLVRPALRCGRRLRQRRVCC